MLPKLSTVTIHLEYHHWNIIRKIFIYNIVITIIVISFIPIIAIIVIIIIIIIIIISIISIITIIIILINLHNYHNHYCCLHHHYHHQEYHFDIIWSIVLNIHLEYCLECHHSGNEVLLILTLRKLFTLYKKCPYSELFWSAFSCIPTEYGEIRSISPYSVRMRENVDQNNSEYGHFSRSLTDQLSEQEWKPQKLLCKVSTRQNQKLGSFKSNKFYL